MTSSSPTTRRFGTAARWGVALASVAAAFALNAWIPNLSEARGVVFLAAVIVSTGFGGFGPGILATIVSVVLLDYFFVPQIHELDFGPAVTSSLIAFVATALLIHSLNHRRRRLEAALRLQNRRKSEFMAVLAHELRNFLSPMAPSLALLERRELGDEVARRTCRTLERQVDTMGRLIEDLLDTARIEEGKARIVVAPVDLVAVMRRAIEAVRPQLEERRHRLEMRLPGVPVLLAGDATRLEQVFVNLLGNAAKYTDPGGTIVVRVGRRSREVRVAIRDNGCGIAPDVLPHVFDLFVQGEAGATGGLGIGLSLVRGIVELHGGRVTVASPGPGLGSEFVVMLPCREAVSERPGRAALQRPADMAATAVSSSGLPARGWPEHRAETHHTPSLPR